MASERPSSDAEASATESQAASAPRALPLEPPPEPPPEESLRHFPRVVGRDGGLYLSCAEVISSLFEYLSEDLEAGRREEFERHLARCHSCRDYLATYRSTILLTRGAFGDDELSGPAITELPGELFEAILAAR